MAAAHSAPEGASLKLLSLDGGGVRGLSSLLILKQLMKRVNPEDPPRPCDYFNLIGGTSTGGLIAIMLGRLGMSIEDCITRYCELSERVFQPKRHTVNWLGRAIDIWKTDGKYRAENLTAEIKRVTEEVENDKGALLFRPDADRSCKVFVCALVKNGSTPALFRSYSNHMAVDSFGTSKAAIWEAARATSAATTFFDPMPFGRQEFVDGATGYNNPVEVVLEEARELWPDWESRIQCLVSIGTGVIEPRDFGNSILEVGKTLASLATETEKMEDRFNKNCVRNGVGDAYFRFNVEKGLDGVGLDEYAKVGKIEAATSAYLMGSRIRESVEKFVSARAPQGSE